MTAPTFPIEELRALADAACDGTLGDGDAARLEELLRGSPEAQRFYLAHVRLDGCLRWEFGYQVQDRTLPPDIASLPQSLTPVAEPATSPIILDLTRTSRYSLTASHSFVGGPVFSYMASAVILGMMLLGAWAYKITHYNQIADAPSATSNARPELVFVGRITGMADCRWADPQTEAYAGASVPLGRKYALSSGLMEITYTTGAKVILQGPCTYEVESSSGGYLALGKLTAKVETKGSGVRDQGSEKANLQISKSPNPKSPGPWPLTPDPFFVRTPIATITDLGTEFGVEVHGQDEIRVCVFDGAVSVVDCNSQGGEIVREGQAVQIASGALQRVDAGEASKHFIRQICPRSMTTLLTDDFANPLLNPKWTWDNPHCKNKYSLTERPGWLRIALAGGDEDSWVGRRGDGPFLRTETSRYPANFSVETLVDVGTANGGTAPVAFVTGLVVYDRDHYVSGDSTNTYYSFDFTYGFHRRGDERLWIEVQACGTDKPLLSASVAFTSAYLKMDRDGVNKTWTMYYKQNAEDSWTRLGVVDDGQLPGGGTTGMELGPFAKTYKHHSPDAKADFDYYHVTPFPKATRGRKEMIP